MGVGVGVGALRTEVPTPPPHSPAAETITRSASHSFLKTERGAVSRGTHKTKKEQTRLERNKEEEEEEEVS